MAPPERQMTDWMRLILVNWVIVAFTMTYSILAGGAVSLAAIWLVSRTARVLGGWETGFTVIPPSTGTLLVLCGAISALFLITLGKLRYDCAGEGYRLRLTRPVLLRALAIWLVCLLALIGMGTVLHP